MATVVFRSRPPLRCTFTLELDDVSHAHRTDGELALRPYGADVTFADPLDTLIGFRAFCEDAVWQRTKLRGWWLSSIATRTAVELLRDDTELARSACAWLAGWTGAPVPERGGMLRFASLIGTDEGIAPPALADDALPATGLLLCRADGTHREILHVTQRSVIGRREGADLVIPEPTVARRHVQLAHGADGWTVEDLDSPGGTMVNELRGRGRVVLAPGSLIRLGQVQLVVLAAEPA